MAWTTPRTWVTAETVTAGLMNTHVRDNLQAAFPTDAVYTSWTPGETLWTLGNGTKSGRYTRIGKFVHCWGTIVLGSTSTLSYGFSTNFPVTPASSTDPGPIEGLVEFYDKSTGKIYSGAAVYSTTTRCRFKVWSTAGSYLELVNPSDTVPFTFTTSDEIHWHIVYEAA